MLRIELMVVGTTSLGLTYINYISVSGQAWLIDRQRFNYVQVFRSGVPVGPSSECNYSSSNNNLPQVHVQVV